MSVRPSVLPLFGGPAFKVLAWEPWPVGPGPEALAWGPWPEGPGLGDLAWGPWPGGPGPGALARGPWPEYRFFSQIFLPCRKFDLLEVYILNF